MSKDQRIGEFGVEVRTQQQAVDWLIPHIGDLTRPGLRYARDQPWFPPNGQASDRWWRVELIRDAWPKRKGQTDRVKNDDIAIALRAIEIQDAKAALEIKQARARAALRKEELERGDVVPVAEVVEALRIIISQAKDHLQHIGPMLGQRAPEALKPVAIEVGTTVVNEVLEQLAVATDVTPAELIQQVEG